MKLYEIANDYLALRQAIDNDEIPEEALADTLEAITGEVEYKADQIACMLKNLDADITAIKAEEVKLAERRKAKEKTYERIKSYLSDALERMSIDKVETARNKITFRRSESVEVDEDVFIRWATEQFNRDDLITVKHTETANKTEIKKILKMGTEMPGVELIVKRNIQLK
jgi:hypothetical protein